MPTPEQRMKALETQAKSAVRFQPGGGAAAVARLTVGGGATIQQISKYQVSLTPAGMGASSVQVMNVTVNGLAPNDWLLINGPASVATALISAVVSGVNAMQVTFVNPTTAAQTPPAGTYTVIAIRA